MASQGKSISVAVANLTAAIAYIPDRYKMGLQGADWEGPAGSDQAEANWQAGVAKAASEKRRQAGVHKAGNQFWLSQSMNKGVNNIGQGIRNGLGKYQTNFAPILQAMNTAAASLPPRTTDFQANINNRLIPVVKAAKQAAGKL